jgi:hypothetical protein
MTTKKQAYVGAPIGNDNAKGGSKPYRFNAKAYEKNLKRITTINTSVYGVGGSIIGAARLSNHGPKAMLAGAAIGAALMGGGAYIGSKLGNRLGESATLKYNKKYPALNRHINKKRGK